MKCPSCGAKALLRDRFCRSCGAGLQESEAMLRAREALSQGDLKKALRALDEAPEGPETLALKGSALALSGREREARPLLEKALVLDPKRWDARYQLASLDYGQGRFAQASEAFKVVRLAQPSLKNHALAALLGGHDETLLASINLYEGLSHKELAHGAEAESCLRRAAELNPKDPLPRGVLGDLAMGRHEFGQAAKEYFSALEVVQDPASRRALRNDYGVACFRDGQLDKAADAFKAVIHEDPKDDHAIHNLGVLYLRQGLNEDMRDDLREFLKVEHAEQIMLGLTRSMVNATRQEFDFDPQGILGRSQIMLEVLDLARRAAASDATVLILGENGTGKELLARALHANSRRSGRPFVAVNCGALPDTLLESELFGYEKGAFTGAEKAKPGRFELAEGGTLFLDEIGDLKLPLQVKLLRAIEEKTFERLGGTGTQKADIRIMAATHQDLRAKVLKGEFREDLFYRLYVVPLTLPPLRQRVEDIGLLAQTFLERESRRASKNFSRIEPQALAKLESHRWPGNVRELENVIARAVAIHDGEALTAKHLLFESAEQAAAPKVSMQGSLPSLDEAERNVIVECLRQAQGRVPEAARKLGVSRATLYRKLQKYQIQ